MDLKRMSGLLLAFWEHRWPLELNKLLDCLLEGTLAIAVVVPRLALC